MAFWKRLSSGKYIDLANMKEDDLYIEDIDNSLNYIYRFTGHYKDREPLTVAQHSLLCLHLAEMHTDDPQLLLATFTHDFAEAYIGDVATPIKKAMGDRWYNFAKPFEEMVEIKFAGTEIEEDDHDFIKAMDLIALDIERRVLWSSQYGKEKWPYVPKTGLTLEQKRTMFNRASRHRHVDITTTWKVLYDLTF